MTTFEAGYSTPVNRYFATPYAAMGLGQNWARTQFRPKNAPILRPTDRPGAEPSPALSLTLHANVSAKQACVPYVSDNAEGQS